MFALFRLKRKGDRVVVQICLSGALLLLHVFNLFHDLAIKNETSCKVFATTIHYSLLSTGMVLPITLWMPLWIFVNKQNGFRQGHGTSWKEYAFSWQPQIPSDFEREILPNGSWHLCSLVGLFLLLWLQHPPVQESTTACTWTPPPTISNATNTKTLLLWFQNMTDAGWLQALQSFTRRS